MGAALRETPDPHDARRDTRPAQHDAPHLIRTKRGTCRGS